MAASFFRNRARTNSMSLVTPPSDSSDYDIEYAKIASKILYKSPLPSHDGLPVYILDSAAFPNTEDIHYSSLLPYVRARLPTDEQLVAGKGYEVIFFAGGADASSDQSGKARPSMTWTISAYNVLTRITRKRIQKLYLVHEPRWVRIILEAFATIGSPKFRRKIVHCSTLSALALRVPIENLLIPPSAYERDRKLAPDIHVPYASGTRAFGAIHPLPLSSTGEQRLPRVLREASAFLLEEDNVKTEGIFRVNARAQSLEILREAYDRGQKFIPWKELKRTMTFPHFQEGYGDIYPDEIAQLDGYGVLTAAGLIKVWYQKLREPIVSEFCYSIIEEQFGTEDEIEPIKIKDLLLNESSPLDESARKVLSMHLFPLLSRVAQHAEQNKMTPKNLGVCFAPALVCGSDPVKDAKLSRILIKVIEAAVANWDTSISKEVGMEGSKFEDLLKTPVAFRDREDSLEGNVIPPGRRSQEEGIVLHEHSNSGGSSGKNSPPALPPRTRASTTGTSIIESGGDPMIPPRNNSVAATGILIPLSTETSPIQPSHVSPTQPPPAVLAPGGSPPEHVAGFAIRRKPAPPMQPPPRYSTIVDLNEAAPRYSTIMDQDRAEVRALALENLSLLDAMEEQQEEAGPSHAQNVERSQAAEPARPSDVKQ